MGNVVYRRKRRRGVTQVELLVATMLLSGSLVPTMMLWRMSRSITEVSRNLAEYYAVARREVERTRVYRYEELFFHTAYAGGVCPPITTRYNQDADIPTAARPALYEAVSTFYRRQTGSEDEQRQLGIQIIDVYRLPRSGGDWPVYSTSLFFTVGGT